MPPCIGIMCQLSMCSLQSMPYIDMHTCDGQLTGMQRRASFHPLHSMISLHALGTTHISVTC